MFAAIEGRGGLGGVVLTHDHEDHAEAVRAVLARFPAPLAAGRGDVDVKLEEGARFGPFYPVATSGHSIDHFALIADGACFTGDAVLGEGSVFIAPHRGLDVQLHARAHAPAHARRLQRALPRSRPDRVGCPREARRVRQPPPGSRACADVRARPGPAHRKELLDAVWPDVSESMRPLASVTLAAHLDKLDDEQVLPEGVQRPTFDSFDW